MKTVMDPNRVWGVQFPSQSFLTGVKSVVKVHDVGVTEWEDGRNRCLVPKDTREGVQTTKRYY